VLLEPGESKEVVWKFSEKSSIEFACNVPGHYQAGMYGEVNFNSGDSRVRSLADASKPLNTAK